AAYEKSYGPIIKGTNGPESWPNPRSHPLDPPEVEKTPGRPKKMRRKEASESPAATKVRRVGVIIHCKKCGKSGHNSKGCGKPKGKKVKKNNKQTNEVESSNPAKTLPVKRKNKHTSEGKSSNPSTKKKKKTNYPISKEKTSNSNRETA
ncbi:Zinc finger, CCHC-type, partial [Parasponia andersonii]